MNTYLCMNICMSIYIDKIHIEMGCWKIPRMVSHEFSTEDQLYFFEEP